MKNLFLLKGNVEDQCMTIFKFSSSHVCGTFHYIKNDYALTIFHMRTRRGAGGSCFPEVHPKHGQFGCDLVKICSMSTQKKGISTQKTKNSFCPPPVLFARTLIPSLNILESVTNARIKKMAELTFSSLLTHVS